MPTGTNNKFATNLKFKMT
jgi:hypothetical protein